MFKTEAHHWETIRVGEILINKGLISQQTLEGAIQTQTHTNQKLGEILVEQGHISVFQLQWALRQQRLMKTMATLLLVSSTGAIAMSQTASSRVVGRVVSDSYSEHGVGGTRLEEETLKSNLRNRPQSPRTTAMLIRGSLTEQLYPTTRDPLVGFCHPMNGKGLLSQGNYGITHQRRMAYAYDLASSIGTPVYAMRAGTILSLRDRYPDTGGGRSRASKYNYVLIEHDGEYRSAYVHLQKDFLKTVPLRKGMTVKAGQLIGYSGNSGWSTGPHLHVEVQRPSQSKKFTKTVPFKVSGQCAPSTVAKAS